MTVKTIKIKGKIFYYRGSFTQKGEAQREAYKIRRSGRNARVIGYFGNWKVYSDQPMPYSRY